MTHIPVWWYALSAINIAGTLAVVALLYLILRRRRGAPPLDETLHTAPCPFSDTCDRVTCQLEKQGMTSMLAAEGGFGDPVCAKCGGPARLIESKVVVVPAEWREYIRFADAVACDSCGFVSEGEVPFISLDPRLRDDDQMMKAAIGAAARELARRVAECDKLGHIHNLKEEAG